MTTECRAETLQQSHRSTSHLSNAKSTSHGKCATAYKKSNVNLATLIEGDPKAPVSIGTTLGFIGGRYSIPRFLHFTLDPHIIVLSAKQGGI